MKRWLPGIVALAGLAGAVLLLMAVAARAYTEDRVLDLIGMLEAPGGYNTVYYGVRTNPPRPITSMTVSEVLDWQRDTVGAGSVSSAAGRYQIIRPTLQSLVDQGVVAPGARFDAATQDRLGRHLLRETGYRSGDASPQTANAIARVWAALPRVGGPGEGLSMYHGIAGNHALISAETFMGVLNGTLSLEDVQIAATIVRAGHRFGFSWDVFLEDLAANSRTILTATAAAGIALLFALFLIDLVLRAGQSVMSEHSPGPLLGDILYRLVTIGLCMVVLLWPDEVIGLIADEARLAATGNVTGQEFSVADHVAGKIALIFSLYEGAMVLPDYVLFYLTVTSGMIVITLALQIALIVWWYLNLFMVAGAGLILVGFGGLRQGVPVTRAYLTNLLGAGLALLALMMVLTLVQDLSWQARADGDWVEAASHIILLEVAATILIWLLPKTVSQLASQGRG